MMLWQKRGTLSLLHHRAKRIVIPFLIFGALLFPILNNMGDFVRKAEDKQLGNQDQQKKSKNTVNLEYQVPNNLGGAACTGNLEKIREWLQKGADINGKYDKDFTPLHWAATMDQVNAIKLLTDEGANLNSRDGHQSTPPIIGRFFWAVQICRNPSPKGS